MQKVPQRIAHALPDAITAGLFLAIWINPHWFSLAQIQSAFAAIGMEILIAVVTIFLFLASIGIKVQSKGLPVLKILMGVFLLCAAGFARSLGIWGFWMFVWLVGHRLWWLSRAGIRNEEMAKTVFGLACLSMIALMLCGIALVLPTPPLGYTAEAIRSMGLPVVSEKQPHAVLPYAFLYYSVRAAAKFIVDWGLGLDPSSEDDGQKLIKF
jgi:hypothetical protein